MPVDKTRCYICSEILTKNPILAGPLYSFLDFKGNLDIPRFCNVICFNKFKKMVDEQVKKELGCQ